MMDATAAVSEIPITIHIIFQILEAIVALVGGGVAIKALLNWITSIHDRNKKIDTYSAEIDNVKAAIAELKEDTDKKMGLIREEQGMITEAMLAVLDGINQIGGNGPVTKKKEELTAYINSSAHHNEF